MTKAWLSGCGVLLLGALGGLPGGGPAAAAAQTGTIKLLVVDDVTGDPVEGAIIRLRDRSPDTLTGPSGRVELTGLEAKVWRIEIRAIGYEPRFETVRVGPDQEVSRRWGLAFTGEKLPDVVVAARRAKLEPRYADFYRRQKGGNGFFITWDVMKKQGYGTIGDVMRRVRGVYVRCQTHDCEISMSRSSFCSPTYWIDGFEAPNFNSSTPIRDVYAMEVYRGAGEMPGEFAGTGGCGAIVIWTMNRPYR